MRALIGMVFVAMVAVAAGCSQDGPPKFYLMGHTLGVTPQPGVASCPGCVLKKTYAFGHGATFGTATVVPDGMVLTQVRTYDANWNPTDLSIPTPTENVPFLNLVNVPSSTTSAVTNWYYRIGPYYYVDTTPLTLQ
jgi:hypothetical protein